MARKEVFRKEDWVFFMDKGKLKFNEKCQGCVHSCKQSFRAVIVRCRLRMQSCAAVSISTANLCQTITTRICS